jgi:hypothetical protein
MRRVLGCVCSRLFEADRFLARPLRRWVVSHSGPQVAISHFLLSRLPWSAVACSRLGLAKLASPFPRGSSRSAHRWSPLISQERQQAAATQGASKLAHSKGAPLECCSLLRNDPVVGSHLQHGIVSATCIDVSPSCGALPRRRIAGKPQPLTLVAPPPVTLSWSGR